MKQHLRKGRIKVEETTGRGTRVAAGRCVARISQKQPLGSMSNLDWLFATFGLPPTRGAQDNATRNIDINQTGVVPVPSRAAVSANTRCHSVPEVTRALIERGSMLQGRGLEIANVVISLLGV